MLTSVASKTFTYAFLYPKQGILSLPLSMKKCFGDYTVALDNISIYIYFFSLPEFLGGTQGLDNLSLFNVRNSICLQ